MPIEIVVADSFDNVRHAVTSALGDAGFKVSKSPLAPGVQVQAKMDFLLGERGNSLLAMFLPFIFKVESLAATLSAYEDGTTAVSIRESGTYGGNVASGAMSTLGHGHGIAGAIGSTVGSMAAYGVDQAAKGAALSKQLAKVDALLREKLAGRIAYEGPVRPGVAQVPA